MIAGIIKIEYGGVFAPVRCAMVHPHPALRATFPLGKA